MIKLSSTKGYGQGSVKSVVFGATGTEKTRMILTAPNPMIFNVEKSLLSVSEAVLPFADIDNARDFQEAIAWVKTSKEADQFQTICFDSISEIAEILLAEYIPKFKDDRQAYKQVQEDILNFLAAMRGQNKFNIYYTAKQITEKDGFSGYVMQKPMMTGRVLSALLEHYVDGLYQSVAHTDKATGKTFVSLKTFSDEKSSCKDRTGALDHWEAPNLQNIYNKIFAKFNSTTN